jgi:hypothetical protein
MNRIVIPPLLEAIEERALKLAAAPAGVKVQSGCAPFRPRIGLDAETHDKPQRGFRISRRGCYVFR